MTLRQIMEDIQIRVQDNQPIGASEWVESSMRANAMKGDLDNLIAQYEGAMADMEAIKVSEGETPPKAKVLSKTVVLKKEEKEIDYTEYLKLKGYQKRVNKFISLGESRSRIRM